MICTEAANTKFIVFGLTHIYHDVQNDIRSHRNKRKMKIKATKKINYNFNEPGNPNYAEVFIKTMIIFSYLIFSIYNLHNFNSITNSVLISSFV
jgi:hypothetical protein